MRFLTLVFLQFMMVLWGCNYYEEIPMEDMDTQSTNGETPALEVKGYAWIRDNIINPSCLRCHNDKIPTAEINYSSYAKTMETGSVIPSNPEESTFYTTMAEGTMPPRKKMTEEQITAVREWIDRGAKENE